MTGAKDAKDAKGRLQVCFDQWKRDLKNNPRLTKKYKKDRLTNIIDISQRSDFFRDDFLFVIPMYEELLGYANTVEKMQIRQYIRLLHDKQKILDRRKR